MKKFLISFAAALALMLGTTYCVFTGTLQTGDSNYKTYTSKATKALDAKDYNTAIVNFEKAIEINPDNYEVYCALGTSYEFTGNNKKAEETLVLATEKFPNEWLAYIFLGDMKRKQKEYPLAIKYYEKALGTTTLPQDKRAGVLTTMLLYMNEQKTYNAKTSIPTVEKISTNLDKNIWEETHFEGTNEHWTIKYGSKSEDAKNHRWTKLVTIDFFDNKVYRYTQKTMYDNFYEGVKKLAYDFKGALNFQKLTSPEDEIYFEWNIAGSDISEICRIFKGKSGLYLGTYAQKKDFFTPEEKTNAINILKSIKEIP